MTQPNLAPNRPPGAPLTMAVIDDDPHTVDILRRYFEYYGFRVVDACDGKPGLDMVAAQHPDIVVLDVIMPSMDGFEVAERLRREFPTLPIIMLSARVDHADKIRGLMIGAHRYLAKPCAPARIMDEVVKLLGLPARPQPQEKLRGGLDSGQTADLPTTDIAKLPSEAPPTED